ncbi:MAG: formylglycine-generating enzyme family protein [Candidatus Competibacteraceae bacterium]|nr:formylglycine-generating enzyme family protein [Candidatus Competibacteraceae bacterium]
MRLAEWLPTEGWPAFIDVQTHVGRCWRWEVEQERRAAPATVVPWPAASRKNYGITDEASAEKDKNSLFPAHIEGVKLLLGFGPMPTADRIGWAGESDHPGLAERPASLRPHWQDADPSLSPTLLPPLLAKGSEQGFQPSTPGQTFRDKLKAGGEGPLMVVIPAGRFVMGSPSDEPERWDSEGPQREVHIAQPFALGAYAVTFDDYDRYCDAMKQMKPSDAGWGRGNRPVINVSWDDARAYCAWLSKQTGRVYRLPSEAEWEYACRAGVDTPFHFGVCISTDQANFDGAFTYNDSKEGQDRQQTVPVGTFSPNAFGLYEMHGNIWEWCQDAWHDDYDGALTDGSAWEADETGVRVVRGGSWADLPGGARSAARDLNFPDARSVSLGFRVWCAVPTRNGILAPLTSATGAESPPSVQVPDGTALENGRKHPGNP